MIDAFTEGQGLSYFIQVTFVLLVLSMITEKVTNFVKLNFRNNWLKRVLNLPPKVDQEKSKREQAKEKKKIHDREVQTLAVFIGLTLALLMRANLFELYNPKYKLGWSINTDVLQGFMDSLFNFSKLGEYVSLIDLNYFTYSIFGSILTGLLLSFGSKFFHDLLDLLLQTKNLRRKLQDRTVVEDLNTIDEFDDFIEEVAPVVIGKEIEEYLKEIEEVKTYEYSEGDETVDVILGEISEENFQKLKPFIRVQLADKRSVTIEFNYIRV